MVTKEFGARCAELRKGMGLSQVGFARTIGMDRSYYSGVESGSRNICLDNIQKIACGYGVSLSFLFRGIGETFTSEDEYG